MLSIADNTFEGNRAIISAEIPENCVRIGKQAFRNCVNLKKIRIPADCTVGEGAFDGCREVYIYTLFGSPAELYCRSHDNCIFVEE